MHLTLTRQFFCLTAFILSGCSLALNAQDTIPKETIVKKERKDSVQKQTHSPKKAAIFSACLPGLGQAYNHKYWKIPIVYAGVGTFGYLITRMNGQYKTFKEAYILRTDGDSTTIDDQQDYTDDQLKENVNFYRRYRDLNVVLLAAVYTLNIVDANVDAHLFTFDVSNDLSLEWHPHLGLTASGKYYTGLSFGLKF